MSFVLKNLSSSDLIGSRLGEGIGEGYMQGSDERAIRGAIESLPENASYRDILTAISGVSTYNPEAKQQAVSNWLKSHEIGISEKQADIAARRQQYLDEEKAAKEQVKAAKQKETEDKKEAERLAKINEEAKKRAEADAIIGQLELPENQRQSLLGNLSKDAAESLLKEQIKETGKESPFEKAVQNKNAEEYIKLSNDIPKIESTIGDIAYARELSDKLGITSIPGSFLGLSPTSKELEAVSFTLMEPIVKIFNPSGPIAQQKLKMIQDKYVIQPGDAPWTRKAKLDALERFAKQALHRAQQKKNLIEKYNGNPPKEAIDKFDRESDTLSDAMINYDLMGEEAVDKELPEAKGFSGKTITAPDGRKFYSDGTRWVKK